MVDMTELSAHHGTDASRSRLRKRRAAEVRLRAYGIAAIAFSGLALVALLWSVIGKVGPALTETYITIEVPLTAEAVGGNLEKPEYGEAITAGLKEIFPSFRSRTERKALSAGIFSGEAEFDLLAAAQTDPSMLGGTVTRRMLAGDDADLYLKGFYGTLRNGPATGELSPVGTEGDVVLHSSANDFAAQLALVKGQLLDKAARLRRQAARQENGRQVRSAEAAEATDPAQRDRLLAQAEGYAAKRDQLIGEAEALETRAALPGGEEELDEASPSILIEVNGGWVKAEKVSNDTIWGDAVIPLTSDAAVAPGGWIQHVYDLPEASRKVDDAQVIALEVLRKSGAVDTVWNTRIFTAGDSREPETAGLLGAIVGSFWTMLVTFCIAFPIGVMAAIYLEEFAPKTKLTDFIEVNINNLAAVPSIVFGLLGLAIFVAGIEVMGVEIGGFVPRSAPLAGGIVLALMTLPTIIIASRAAIRAVPPSIRDAALGLGASKLQTSFHHVLPLAMPGIMTGTIIGMAQALGETAPLIMIGMVAFIVETPGGILESATVLPVQVFRWSDFPERAFEARTAAAICVLLLFLVIMNALAVVLRKQFERRW